MFNIDLNNDKVVHKKALGRGLDVLIPEKEKRRGFVNIEIEKIIPNALQPRKNFAPEELSNLAASIKEKGVLQPVIVRSKGSKYELVVGERRYRAVKSLGLSVIPAIIKELSDRDMLEMALIENIQREDLDAIEKAEGFLKLMNDFGLTHDELARHVGQSRTSVTNTLRLLKLPHRIKKGISYKKINMSQARTLLGLKSEHEQIQMYERILENPLNVRDLEEMVSDIQITLDPKSVTRKKRKKDPQLGLLEDELREIWGTKIIVRGNNKKGRIEIHYYSLDDLDRILKQLKLKKPS